MSETCSSCNVTDDENHRLNECTRWTVDFDRPEINFDDIYSTQIEVIDNLIQHFNKVWELKYANGRMKTKSHWMVFYWYL